MCGIAGILNADRPIDPAELDRFTDALAHRGPDGRGTFVDGRVGLGHRRLAILDPTDAGRCPMPYGGGDGRRYWITYNGEVYNFPELRRELESLGYAFRSRTDTEVLAAAYAHWGSRCLARLNGMWAFAIYDTAERRLFAARDRFGIKPFHFMEDGTRFAFASEVKAFRALTGFAPALDEDAAARFLRNPVAYDGNGAGTAMKGVRRLPAGHFLTVHPDGRVVVERWWSTAEHVRAVPGSYEDQVEAFRDLFRDAVRIRMRSDVPVGTCLSGGIDSSAVAGAMAWLHGNGLGGLDRCPEDWRRAFVATFPGTPLDERRFAEAVARHTGARPVFWVFDGKEAAARIVDTAHALDDLSGAPAVPVWAIYREMRRHGVPVSLDGHGGDELLCGYAWCLDWPMRDVNANLYRDFHEGILPSILRNYDRCSMAHGIEVRMPILDYRLVCYAFGLPPEAKAGGGFTKRILRDAAEGTIPETVRRRRSKIGFNSPLVEWLNGDLVGLVERLTSHELWLGSPFWDGRKMRDLVTSRCRAAAWVLADWDAAMKVYAMLNVVLWQLLFVTGEILPGRDAPEGPPS